MRIDFCIGGVGYPEKRLDLDEVSRRSRCDGEECRNPSTLPRTRIDVMCQAVVVDLSLVEGLRNTRIFLAQRMSKCIVNAVKLLPAGITLTSFSLHMVKRSYSSRDARKAIFVATRR